MTTETLDASPGKRMSQGIIEQALPNNLYLVNLERGYSIQAHVGATMKKFNVRVLPGDKVEVELSPFDISRGKITQRNH